MILSSLTKRTGLAAASLLLLAGPALAAAPVPNKADTGFVFLSTVLVHQHHVIDVLAALLLVVALRSRWKLA